MNHFLCANFKLSIGRPIPTNVSLQNDQTVSDHLISGFGGDLSAIRSAFV